MDGYSTGMKEMRIWIIFWNIPLRTEFCQCLLETVYTPWSPAHKGNMHPWGVGGNCTASNVLDGPVQEKTLHNQIFIWVVLCVLRVDGFFTLHRNRGCVEWLLHVCEVHICTMIQMTSEISKVVSFLLHWNAHAQVWITYTKEQTVHQNLRSTLLMNWLSVKFHRE